MADGSPTSFNADIMGKTLTKAEFVEAVYSSVGLSRRDSADVIELLFESIKETLEKTDPELSADLVERGMVLCGGGV